MVQHIETGHCNGCLGRENARNAIYNQVSQRAPNFVTSTPMLEYGGYGAAQAPATNGYQCPHCPNRYFNDASQLLQHTAAKHPSTANSMYLGY